MEYYPWPKLQELLPKHSQSELIALKASIRDHGVLENGVALSDGRILDGANRYQISKGQMIFKIVDLRDEDALALGIALNAAKRNLSNEQIITLQEKLRKDKELQVKTALQLYKQGKTQPEIAAIIGVNQSTISDWNRGVSNMGSHITYVPEPIDLRISIPKNEYDNIFERRLKGESQVQIAADYKVSRERISQIERLLKARTEKPELNEQLEFPEKRYHCLVIDPPWPTQKIEREERPNQGPFFDYPTMTLEQIEKEIPISKLADPKGCHVYLWVTQKFLPNAIEIFEKWGAKYQCLLTWVKPTGITPFSWMYNTEHIIFGRIGSLELNKLGIKLSFESPVREHSRKPDIFYDIVRQVSPNPRLELFARERREGFEAWGNEVDKFV